MKLSVSPCDVGHGAEGVVTLGDGDPGHLIHSEYRTLLFGQSVHELGVLRRVDETHQCRTGLQQFGLMYPQRFIKDRPSNLQHSTRQ